MPDFEQISTEYINGSVGYADYGSRVRVLMRSETHIMFVGYGLNIYQRGGRSSHSTQKIAPDSKKDSISLPAVREKIISVFGEGADEMAIKAISTRGKGTILVGGGGETPLPPAHIHRQQVTAVYETISPTTGYTVERRGCLQCGNPLKPHTTHHHLDFPKEGSPKTVEDCQKLSNLPVIAVRGFEMGKPKEWWPYISWFETWDGESYENDPFCSNSCAAEYGFRAAAELAHLPTGGKAVRIKHSYETVNHRPKSDKTVIIDGVEFKI